MTWPRVKLGEIASNIQTGPFGSQLHQADYSDSGIPVVMPKDLVEGKISEATIARVSADHVVRLSKHRIEVGDILYSRRGDVGRCAYADQQESGWLCGTGCLRVTIDKSLAYPRFVFYQLQTPSSIGWVEKHAIGATMLNINTSILADVPLALPPLEVQRRIADILSAYDDLIENNRKQIKLLEEAAQRLYKEWFIDLRFPGHEHTPIINGIPEGWEKKCLGDILAYERGRSYTSDEISDSAKVLLVNLKNIKAWGGYNRNAEKHFAGAIKQSQLLNHNDIVMAVTDMTQERRLVGHVALIPHLPLPAIFSMDLIRITPKNLPNLFLYAILAFGGYGSKVSLLANGTNVLHVKPEAMMSQSMLIPPKHLVDGYEKAFSSIMAKIECIERQNDNNSAARNLLLPKLMRGELTDVV